VLSVLPQYTFRIVRRLPAHLRQSRRHQWNGNGAPRVRAGDHRRARQERRRDQWHDDAPEAMSGRQASPVMFSLTAHRREAYIIREAMRFGAQLAARRHDHDHCRRWFFSRRVALTRRQTRISP